MNDFISSFGVFTSGQNDGECRIEDFLKRFCTGGTATSCLSLVKEKLSGGGLEYSDDCFSINAPLRSVEDLRLNACTLLLFV